MPNVAFTGSVGPAADAVGLARPGAPTALAVLLALAGVGGGVARAEQAPTDAVPPGSTTGSAPAAARFDVLEYRVLGNTVLPGRDIEQVLYPLLGEHKVLADVETARASLEKLYHDRGFATVFVDIPPQEIHEGIVRLHVTEGRLHESRVTGARYFSEPDIAAALPAAQVGAVPNLPALQQQLSALNNANADRSAVPVIKAGPVPGTMDLEFKVSDKLPLHGSIEVDDNYTAYTKPLRATGALSYDNLFGALDTASLQYQDSPQALGQVAVFTASYLSRPLADGWRISASYTDSDSDVANIGSGGLGVLGKGQLLSARFTRPTFSSTTSLQSVILGIDYKHFRDAIGAGGTSSPLVTPISYTNLSAGYAGSWIGAHFDPAVNVAANFGLRDAPNSPNAFENKRYLGRPNYFYIRWDGTVMVHLPSSFQLMLRCAGQEANEPLISNENFPIAGSDGVRGYLEAEELGDKAVKGTVQLQSPDLAWHQPHFLNAFAFLDLGRMQVIDALPEQVDHALLRSWGGGINLLPNGPVSGALTWADPLESAAYTQAHQSRILFTVRAGF